MSGGVGCQHTPRPNKWWRKLLFKAAWNEHFAWCIEYEDLSYTGSQRAIWRCAIFSWVWGQQKLNSDRFWTNMDTHCWAQQPPSIVRVLVVSCHENLVRLSSLFVVARHFPWVQGTRFPSNRTQNWYEKCRFFACWPFFQHCFCEWFGPMFNVPVGHLILWYTISASNDLFKMSFVDPQ